ncbi:MAG: cyanoexosortase A system-associated protein [Xenococcaceae cyanobacterium]
MISWKKIRITLLGLQLAGVLFVLGKSILYPPVKDSTVTPFVFPTTVPLPQWQLVKTGSVNSQLVKPPAYISGKYVSGKYYRYIQNNLSLDIEMRYLVNTNGNLKSFIKSYTGQLFHVLHEQKGVGFYSMFVYQGQAYLSACINPRGYSTVTTDQFRRNSLLYDVRLARIASWLISQAEIVDNRCLWAHFSMPLNNSSKESAYETIETAWFDWYQWWSLRFPNP